jgi:hypothetical protein
MVCPTDYCRRMADASGDDWAYLRTLGAGLGPDVDVCWTGDEIVSERIDAASLADVAAALGRAPLIWDNLHANDYDLRRLYLGPLAGRSADLPAATAGFLTNPNTPFEVNEIAFATLAAYLADPAGYDPARAWAPRSRPGGRPSRSTAATCSARTSCGCSASCATCPGRAGRASRRCWPTPAPCWPRRPTPPTRAWRGCARSRPRSSGCSSG